MALFLALSLARLAKLAAAMVVFGSALFALYAPAGARRSGPPLGAAALALAVSLLAWLACTAVGMAGDDGDAGWPSADVLGALVLGTGFGRAWAVQMALAALLLVIVAAGRGSRAASPLILVPAAGVLVAEAWIGHAAAGRPGGSGWPWMAAMAVHLLAAGAWLGGLVPLARTLLEAQRAGDGASRSMAFATLRRFSRMGYVAVALILLTGAANTVYVVGSGGALTMSYGLALTVKLLLAAFLASLALANRMVLVPRLAEEGEAAPDALEALGRTVALEQVMGLLVLAAVSVLGILSPTVGVS